MKNIKMVLFLPSQEIIEYVEGLEDQGHPITMIKVKGVWKTFHRDAIKDGIASGFLKLI